MYHNKLPLKFLLLTRHKKLVFVLQFDVSGFAIQYITKRDRHSLICTVNLHSVEHGTRYKGRLRASITHLAPR